jgi:hypothetical protein
MGGPKNQNNHILTERRCSREFQDDFFSLIYSDNDHYLVATTVRERPSLSKQTIRNFYVVGINTKQQKAVEVKEECQVKISNIL